MTDNKPISESVRFMEKMADILMDEANAEIEQLRKERDEARREVMFWMSERSSTSEMTAEYKKRGWDYLKDHA